MAAKSDGTIIATSGLVQCECPVGRNRRWLVRRTAEQRRPGEEGRHDQASHKGLDYGFLVSERNRGLSSLGPAAKHRRGSKERQQKKPQEIASSFNPVIVMPSVRTGRPLHPDLTFTRAVSLCSTSGNVGSRESIGWVAPSTTSARPRSVLEVDRSVNYIDGTLVGTKEMMMEVNRGGAAPGHLLFGAETQGSTTLNAGSTWTGPIDEPDRGTIGRRSRFASDRPRRSLRTSRLIVKDIRLDGTRIVVGSEHRSKEVNGSTSCSMSTEMPGRPPYIAAERSWASSPELPAFHKLLLEDVVRPTFVYKAVVDSLEQDRRIQRDQQFPLVRFAF